MKTTNETHLTTVERLNLALASVPEPTRTELENFYWLANPIDFARELISLELPVDVTRELLLCKVSQRKKYDGPSLRELAERVLDSQRKEATNA